ncbi:hypothetical protein HF320_03775 [Collinsella sp. KGMB02528]|uniref:NlpC/P60 domain-containing protein n=1 Tax=Collinsella acetigenes TaxID=2713419 RepID=A0A7X9UBH1_9ACTN|nr:GH25 family lysozyme [Collinsella acetigenes]NMF55451.1 hypothetical protein [Collinsella acetigenes]
MNRFKHLIKAAAAIALTYVLCASALLQPMAVYAATLQAQQPAAEVADASSAQDSSAGDVSDDTTDGVSKDADSADAAQDKATLTGAADEDVAANGEDAAAPESLDAGDEQTTDDTVIGDSEANSWRYQNGELRSDLQDDNATDLGIESRSMREMPEGATLQGIDVSGHQKDIDWQKVRDAGIDFAILKIGNINAREPDGWYTDSYFQRNVTECERLGIPYGVYAYSYAKNADDAVKGADHIIALLKGHNPTLPVYLDLEDNSIKDTDHATIATAFCNTISAAGYTPGIYANASWFKNILTDPCFTNSGWNIWTAQYRYGQRYDASLGLGPEYPAKFDCWQYSCLSTVPGIDGYCDINYWYRVSTRDHWEKTEDGVFYVSADGQPYKGWKLISGLWYWLDPAKGGAMATGPAEVEGTWYVFSSSGALSSGWVRKDGEWYYGASGGKMVRGWVKGSAWYYTDPESGRMLTGAVEIDGKSYWLDPANGGACARSAWVEMPEGFLSYAANDGVLCMAVKDGVLYKDATFTEVLSGWVDCGDDRLYADSQGHVLTGWQRIDENWYLFDSNGIMHRGWYWNGSAYYYLDKSNGIMRTGWVSDLGSWYWLDPDNGGAMATGWKKVGQSWYYLNPNNGGRMVTGSLMIDGYIRTFNSDGSCIYWGYQNPSNYYQVSSKSVTIPHLGQGIFGYRTESRISVSATRDECVNAMITRAYDYVGTTPYIWDYSCAPGVGVDCAGLVMQCLYATGMDLGRYTPWDHYYTPGHDHYANDMWNDPKFKHLDFSQRRRGDLICYNGHIAIYLGNDQIIEAASPRYGVRVHSVYVGYPIKGVLRPFV